MTDKLVMVYDTETSGFRNKNLSYDDKDQAWVVQLAWILGTEERIISCGNFIINNKIFLEATDDYIYRTIHPKAAEVHGISVEDSSQYGHYENKIACLFLADALESDLLVCHNYAFDIEFLKDMIARNYEVNKAIFFAEKPHYCTMKNSTDYCAIPHGRWRNRFKWPKLTELHEKLFGCSFDGAHDALEDVRATRKCYYELIKLGL